MKLNNIRANYEFQEGVLTLFISLLKSPYVSDAYRGRNGFSGGGRGTLPCKNIFSSIRSRTHRKLSLELKNVDIDSLFAK